VVIQFPRRFNQEETMSEPKPRAKPEAPKPIPRTPFKKMTRDQKTVYVLKVVVCLCTFGFIFPNVIG
jgi:hypothetical protein